MEILPRSHPRRLLSLRQLLHGRGRPSTATNQESSKSATEVEVTKSKTVITKVTSDYPYPTPNLLQGPIRRQQRGQKWEGKGKTETAPPIEVPIMSGMAQYSHVDSTQRSLFKVTSTSLLDKSVAFLTVHISMISQRLHAMNDANWSMGIILECITLPGDTLFAYIWTYCTLCSCIFQSGDILAAQCQSVFCTECQSKEQYTVIITLNFTLCKEMQKNHKKVFPSSAVTWYLTKYHSYVCNAQQNIVCKFIFWMKGILFRRREAP